MDTLLDMEKGCGWAFGEKHPDPHHPTFTHLKEVYKLNDPDYSARVSVPVLFDLKVKTRKCFQITDVSIDCKSF